MALLGQSAFLKALGWALLNSIWQMGLLWLVFIILTACMRKLTAQMKHSLAVILLATGFGWFAFTLVVQYLNFSEAPLVVSSVVEGTSTQTFADFYGILSRNIESSLSYLSLLYLGVTLFLFFRFAAQYRHTRHLCSHNIIKPKADLRIYVQQIAERMGIRKDIKLWISEMIDTPMTIGFFKPVILMPIASINGLSTQQVEAILLHELSHIRRNDYLVNLLIASIDIILFFNPFSRLFVQSIKKEREHSCDDLVLQFEYNAHAYASALLAIERKRVMKFTLAMAATGKNNRFLLDRVKRILNQPVSNHYTNKLTAHLFSALMIGLIAWSNPGNVIVHEILKIDNNKFLASNSEETVNTISFKETLGVKKATITRKKNLAKEKIQNEINLALEKEMKDAMPYEFVAAANHAYAPSIITASELSKLRDFSIAEPVMVPTPEANVLATTPFIPSTSFSYYFVQDSSKPIKMNAQTSEQKAANETLKKALKAIEEINWVEIEKGLTASGEKVDVKKFQEELKRSLKQLDWERINVEASLEALTEQTKLNEVKLYNELKKTALTTNQFQEHNKNYQKKIIEDQLKCQEDAQKKEEELKTYLQNKRNTKKVNTVKKIVVI